MSFALFHMHLKNNYTNHKSNTTQKTILRQYCDLQRSAGLQLPPPPLLITKKEKEEISIRNIAFYKLASETQYFTNKHQKHRILQISTRIFYKLEGETQHYTNQHQKKLHFKNDHQNIVFYTLALIETLHFINKHQKQCILQISL